MEQERCQCLRCGRIHTWVDYKTAIGKTPEQIEAWRKRLRECHEETCKGPMVTVHREDGSRPLTSAERQQLLAVPEAERLAELRKIVGTARDDR